MECREAREHLAELNRGWLSPDLEEAVRSHATGCASCGDIVRREVRCTHSCGSGCLAMRLLPLCARVWRGCFKGPVSPSGRVGEVGSASTPG